MATGLKDDLITFIRAMALATAGLQGTDLEICTEKSLGERQHRRRASSANITLVLQRAHFGLGTRRL